MGVEEVPISAAGKKVVIIGGGDTGATALALHIDKGSELSSSIRNNGTSSWWRNVQMGILANVSDDLQTTSAHEEGGERIYSVNTEKFVGDEDGNVRRIFAAHEVEFKDGRFEGPGSDFELEADAVFLAMGFTGPEKGRSLNSIRCRPRREIQCQSLATATSQPMLTVSGCAATWAEGKASSFGLSLKVVLVPLRWTLS